MANFVDARVTFETVVSRLASKTETLSKAKPLYAYFHKYESQYGELSQISKLEHRMAELFTDDPKLSQFASRYSAEGFDPTAVRLVVSPATQTRSKNVIQSIEQPQQQPLRTSPGPAYAHEASRSPRPQPQFLQTTNSPKRPFPNEDVESELNPPRKLARGASPLKGAAGRRLDQQKRLQQGTPSWQSNAPPFVVPRDITFLLSIIPRADLYTSSKFKPEAVVKLLRETIVPDFKSWKMAKEESSAPPQGRYDGTYNSSYVAPSQPQAGWQNQEYRGAASYGGAAYAVPAYSAPVPAPVRSGYHETDSGNGLPAAPPVLASANNWYGDLNANEGHSGYYGR